MNVVRVLPFALLLAFTPLIAAEPLAIAPQPRAVVHPVAAVVESSLATGNNQIRQFAFDGNPDTYFASEKNAAKTDHFTLTFDTPVSAKSVRVVTGRPKGGDALTAGVVEVSTDGKQFEELAKFADGMATGTPKAKVLAVRIRPTEDLKYPLVIREITIDSDPAIAVFKYPIEFVLDVSDAPEMKEWAEKVARVCERQYPMICDELPSDGFKPLTVIHMTLKNNYNGVAATGGGRITGSVKYFKAHLDDIGAMVHETVHAVQLYRGRGNPGWLVEGIADYIRFFKYEGGKIGIKLTPERAKYDGSYRITAAFLAFVVEKYDSQIVRKLNAIMREGKYKEDAWKEATGKTVDELGREWQKSLAK
jgi:Peptidase of plants and bacteria/F5/8 type C domain